jgi:hypothetical protein
VPAPIGAEGMPEMPPDYPDAQLAKLGTVGGQPLNLRAFITFAPRGGAMRLQAADVDGMDGFSVCPDGFTFVSSGALLTVGFGRGREQADPKRFKLVPDGGEPIALTKASAALKSKPVPGKTVAVALELSGPGARVRGVVDAVVCHASGHK